jgi:hypothetical protein
MMNAAMPMAVEILISPLAITRPYPAQQSNMRQKLPYAGYSAA